jgi:hypothetical protein
LWQVKPPGGGLIPHGSGVFDTLPSESRRRQSRLRPGLCPALRRGRGGMAGGSACFCVGVAPVRRRRVWPTRRDPFELGQQGLQAGIPLPVCRVPSPHGGGSHFWVRRARCDSSRIEHAPPDRWQKENQPLTEAQRHGGIESQPIRGFLSVAPWLCERRNPPGFPRCSAPRSGNYV